MNEAVLKFEAIHEEYRPKILRYLTRMVGEDEAEDLTQEVFVKVHRALSGFKGDSKLSTWLYRIATNTALDRLRSPSFRRTGACMPLTEESMMEERETGRQIVVAEREDTAPERLAFRQERVDCYRGVLDALPVNYRTVVALSELGDLAVDEIARILGLTPATVKIRLHRGRERLIRELKAHCRAEDWL